MSTSDTSANIQLTVYPPSSQGRGAFDGGKITEIKPIAFPHEKGAVPRVGPLFYWAWATSSGTGLIPLHPHRGFEIVSYVLAGRLGHRDTLGTESVVGEGGAQVMQTNSGVSHEEQILGEHTEFFQIWFEPDIRQTLRLEPTYRELQASDIAAQQSDGVTTRTIIPLDSEGSLISEVAMVEHKIASGSSFTKKIDSGWSMTAVVIEGQGQWSTSSGETIETSGEDFVVAQSKAGGELTIQSTGDKPLWIMVVDVPTDPEYPLYDKG